MKFRYYITDIGNGKIKGTDDTARAFDYSLCEDYFVVDSESGEWLTVDGKRVEIEE